MILGFGINSVPSVRIGISDPVPIPIFDGISLQLIPNSLFSDIFFTENLFLDIPISDILFPYNFVSAIV